MRVSTNRQKDEGFSIPNQKRMLEQLCKRENFNIVGRYEESHSAKNFSDRPEFNRFMSDLKSGRVQPEIFVCAEIDRFSRNLVESIQMHQTLKKYGVSLWFLNKNYELDKPDDYMRFTIQSLFAEHDNLVRSEKTKKGMRQAQREGYWISTPPKGYEIQKINDRPVLVPKEGDSELIKKAFDLFSTGIYSAEEVRRMLIEKGLKNCSKNQFLLILRNIVYIGKITVKEWRDEPMEIVEGRHEGIIDDLTFDKVQNLLDSKRKNSLPKKSNDQFPLIGILICPETGRPLRGSSPKGRNKHYSYYHCERKKYGCSCSYHSVEKVHDSIMELFNSFNIRPEVAQLYYEILKDVFKSDDESREKELAKLSRRKKYIEERLESLLDMLVDKRINQKAYDRGAKKNEKELETISARIDSLKEQDSSFDTYLKFGLSLMVNLPKYYAEAEIRLKKKIVGSIFPNKLVFDGEKTRTVGSSIFLELMTNVNKGFKILEKEKVGKSADPSYQAPPVGLEPTTY